jgi:hypothetical protein
MLQCRPESNRTFLRKPPREDYFLSDAAKSFRLTGIFLPVLSDFIDYENIRGLLPGVTLSTVLTGHCREVKEIMHIAFIHRTKPRFQFDSFCGSKTMPAVPSVQRLTVRHTFRTKIGKLRVASVIAAHWHRAFFERNSHLPGRLRHVTVDRSMSGVA